MAIKFLERGPGIGRGVVREVLNHRLLVAHPHIVRFREAFLTPRHLAIVMEYAAGGDMFEYVIRHKVRARASRDNGQSGGAYIGERSASNSRLPSSSGLSCPLGAPPPPLKPG